LKNKDWIEIKKTWEDHKINILAQKTKGKKD
jgi:hypothetical protein